jgi:hypothetical protein
MNPKFREAVESLHPKYEQLIAHKGGNDLPKNGVYIFHENGRPIYVGRSRNIPRRRKDHISDAPNKAALARLIACEQLGIERNYGKGRDKYKSHPGFAAAFQIACNRVRAMEFRAVEECDPTRQALLEIYCAIAAHAPFNDFDVH